MTQFIVGPTEMFPSTKNVLERGYTYFRTDEFGDMVKACLRKVSEFMGNSTPNSTIYLTASGTGAMDAVVDNCLTLEDNALVINGGSFGKRFCELLSWHNIPFDSIDLDWNQVVENTDLLLYENKGYTTLFVNLDETSSGKLYDIKLLSDFCKRNNMMLIVDAISTFLADDYDMDKYGIDVTIISSQKGLCLSAGLSIVSFSQRMLDKLKNNPLPKSYYFNFRDYFRNIERGQTPYTPAVTIMYELNDMLNLIDENGGKDVWINKVKEKTQYFRKRANELGLVVPDYPKSNTLTPLYFEDINALELVKLLQKKYELFVNPCGGELATKLLRVSHIGNTNLEDIDNLLDKIMFSIEEIKKGELVYDRQ